MVGEHPSDEQRASALSVAHAHCQLQLITREMVKCVERHMDAAPADGNSDGTADCPDPAARAHALACDELKRLDRYQTRALSQLRKALQRLNRTN